MSNYIFIVLVIIISLLATIYIFRHFIAYFFKLCHVSIKNKHSLKKIQKIGIKKRNLSNKDIQGYIKLSKKYLTELHINFNKKYVLNADLERRLRFSRFEEKYLRDLLDDILDYMELDKNKISFKVNYISSKYSIKYAGSYSSEDKHNSNKILLNLKNDMSLNTVISILAHECSHYLLLSNNIKLDKTLDNECLTDITTIVLGFGKYLLDGYQISNRVIYNGPNLRSVTKDRVGYLTFRDVQYAIKHI
ncbi:MAG: hypothetical protein J6A89_03315 [Clostridia bacterium]|nr:hypothetical protein [Clostridia bacterium]